MSSERGLSDLIIGITILLNIFFCEIASYKSQLFGIKVAIEHEFGCIQNQFAADADEFSKEPHKNHEFNGDWYFLGHYLLEFSSPAKTPRRGETQLLLLFKYHPEGAQIAQHLGSQKADDRQEVFDIDKHAKDLDAKAARTVP